MSEIPSEMTDLTESKHSNSKPQPRNVNFGCLLAINSSLSAEIMAQADFSWLCIDLQHGMMGIETCMAMLQSISVSRKPTFIRTPSIDSGLIGKMLDAGAQGIVIPSVESEEQARLAVSACKYPPLGIRSVGPTRPRLYNLDYTSEANHYIECFLMIENKQGLENIEEIAQVNGVSGLMLGPADLCISCEIEPGSSEFGAVKKLLVEVCNKYNIASVTFADNPTSIRESVELGFTHIILGVDIHFLANGAKQALEIR